jgi:hypothetical protein
LIAKGVISLPKPKKLTAVFRSFSFIGKISDILFGRTVTGNRKFETKDANIKAVKFALNASNEFNSNTNFSPELPYFSKNAVTGSGVRAAARKC